MKKITLLTVAFLSLATIGSVKADTTVTEPTPPQTEQTTPLELPNELLGFTAYIGEGGEQLNYGDTVHLDKNVSYNVHFKVRSTNIVPKNASVTLTHDGTTQTALLNSNGTANIQFVATNSGTLDLDVLGFDNSGSFMQSFGVAINEPTPTQPSQPPPQTAEPTEPSQPVTPTEPTQPSTIEPTTEQTTEPTPTQAENKPVEKVEETPVYTMDTLPQTGNKDTLGTVLQVLGVVIMVTLSIFIGFKFGYKKGYESKD